MRLFAIAGLAALGLAGIGLAAWKIYGPVNVPIMPVAAATWEQSLRERIKVPEDWRFSVFAKDLGTPRLMQMTASGDIIVSGFTSGAILLVKADRNGDGRSDGTAVLKDGLDLPHGLVLEGSTLYVAEQTRVVAFDFDGAHLTRERVILDGLPAGGAHVSRTLKRGPDGYFYLSLGSSCNSCIETNPWRATMLRFREGKKPEVFAQGLRNTVGFDWQPGTGNLYGVDNGRDNLGDDVPDDEVNWIEPGHHYGWPYVHGAGVPDPSLAGSAPAGITFTPPVHGLGAHVAPLSILFLKDEANAALVAEHGSWNRSRKAGYRIVRLTFSGDGSMKEQPFLTGCEVNDDVICRPVGLVQGPDGSLYVSDDYTGATYRIFRQG